MADGDEDALHIERRRRRVPGMFEPDSCHARLVAEHLVQT